MSEPLLTNSNKTSSSSSSSSSSICHGSWSKKQKVILSLVALAVVATVSIAVPLLLIDDENNKKSNENVKIPPPLEVLDARSTVWPLPQSIVLSANPEEYLLNMNEFQFVISPDYDTNPTIDSALARYRGYIFMYPDWNSSSVPVASASAKRRDVIITIPSLTISVADVNADLQLGVDESYHLVVDSGKATLFANTTWGCLHGLETFSQLVWYNDVNQSYVLPFGPYEIYDYPRFPHRGVMIDTSRHFLPIDVIERIIDGLEASKCNVLHWHISDTQSFPAFITDYPGLTTHGAWATDEIYTPSDMANVVSYARDRGVRVVPEFDMPGHTLSWLGASSEEDIVVCQPPNPYGYNGQLDPTLDVTYDVIQSILIEMQGIFTDNFFHFGYDEIVEKCWTEEAHIAEFMKQRGFKNYIELLQYFTDRVMALNNGNKIAVFWEEVFLEDIHTSTPSNTSSVIQVWIDFDVMYDALKDGRKVILSNSQVVYLDCIGDDATGYLLGHTWCTYNSWAEMYQNEPFPKGSEKKVSAKDQENLIGGETASWGERTDETNAETKAFPRTSAYAERLWSNKDDIEDLVAAKYRIIRHRCHLRRRGVNAEPIVPSDSSNSCYFMISGANFHNS